MSGTLDGRAAIVTGGSQGLGIEIARAYVSEGASVLICARERGPLEESAAELEPLATGGQSVLTLVADVSKDAAELVATAIGEFGKLDVLVNNAGVYGPKGPIEEIDWEAWKAAVEVNLFGSVLMARSALPHFKERGGGKIVQLSGGGATGPLPNISAYACSKTAIVRFVETLAVECEPHGIDVNAIAPGALNTRLLDEVLEAGPEMVGRDFYEKAVKQSLEGGAPLAEGAQLAVFLGSAESDGLTGKLISAVWDPWRSFPEHKEDLKKSDVYTLRRIVPEERGLAWG
jgi:NAD(P)-dependent dehydrogenase (short-subunit alcohol dehydrogenase family)